MARPDAHQRRTALGAAFPLAVLATAAVALVARVVDDRAEPAARPPAIAVPTPPAPHTAFFRVGLGKSAAGKDEARILLRVTNTWPTAIDVLSVTPLDSFHEPAAHRVAAVVRPPGTEVNDPGFSPAPGPVRAEPGRLLMVVLKTGRDCARYPTIRAIRLRLTVDGFPAEQVLTLSGLGRDAGDLAPCQS